MQTFQLPLTTRHSQIYLTAEVENHSLCCCYVTVFSPFLVYNDTHYPMKIIESHLMTKDTSAAGLEIPPKVQREPGDLREKRHHMLLFSRKYNKVKLQLLHNYETPFSKRFALNKTFTDGDVSLQGVKINGQP